MTYSSRPGCRRQHKKHLRQKSTFGDGYFPIAVHCNIHEKNVEWKRFHFLATLLPGPATNRILRSAVKGGSSELAGKCESQQILICNIAAAGVPQHQLGLKLDRFLPLFRDRVLFLLGRQQLLKKYLCSNAAQIFDRLLYHADRGAQC